MTKEVEGTVQKILSKQTDKGESFRVIRLNDGEGYFDWNGYIAKSGVKQGDAVKLKVKEGEFPRIESIQIVAREDFNGLSENVPELNGKDALIVRMSCLRSAAELLAGVDETAEKKRDKVLALAEAMVAWVSNGHNVKA